MKKQIEGMYVRVLKEVFVDIPDPSMTYEETLAYAAKLEANGDLEYELYIDVLFEDGSVANEAGWEE